MDTTKVIADGFTWHIRVPEGYQDVKILTEVIADDTYGLRDMAAHGFYPETIVDIGGHIGTFGVFAKSLWPNAKLIAAEPDPTNFELYKKNIKENCKDLAWIDGKAVPRPTKIVNAAVGYDSQLNYIVKSPRTSGGWFVRNRDEALRCVTEIATRCNEMKEIKTITLEGLTKDVGRIDLLKLDCEGAEWDILLNFSQPERLLFVMGETHVRKSHWDVPFREPRDNIFWRIKVWERIKRKYPNLAWNYEFARRSLFQAGPKVA